MKTPTDTWPCKDPWPDLHETMPDDVEPYEVRLVVRTSMDQSSLIDLFVEYMGRLNDEIESYGETLHQPHPEDWDVRVLRMGHLMPEEPKNEDGL
jgi:hypothetical protein